MGIHLVRVEQPNSVNQPTVDEAELSGEYYGGNSRLVTDLVMVDGRCVAIEHLDDGDGPLVEED